jgi:hypothetical protein
MYATWPLASRPHTWVMSREPLPRRRRQAGGRSSTLGVRLGRGSKRPISAKPDRISLSVSLTAAIVGALIGATSSLVATKFSLDAGREDRLAEQRMQLEEEQRKLRAEAYVSFSEAAESYRESAISSNDCRALRTSETEAIPQCQAKTEPARWFALQKSSTGVLLYGSEEAFAISEQLTTIVRNLRNLRLRYECEATGNCTGGLTGKPGSGPNSRRMHEDYLAYLERYLIEEMDLRQQFLKRMCVELSPLPRKTC